MSERILQWLVEICFKYVAEWLLNLAFLARLLGRLPWEHLPDSGKSGNTNGKGGTKHERQEKKGNEMRSRRDREGNDYI